MAAVTSADKKRVKLLKRLPEAEDAKTLTVMAKKDDLKVKTKEQRHKGKINEEVEHENEVQCMGKKYKDLLTYLLTAILLGTLCRYLLSRHCKFHIIFPSWGKKRLKIESILIHS